MRTPVSVGVVGTGRWGPTLLRAFDQIAAAELRWIFDHSAAAALRAWRRVPSARVATRLTDMLEDEALDAVVVATPPAARAELVRRALAAGKHVLVEPPFAFESGEAEALVLAAEHAGRRLVTSHTSQFHPGARRLRELVAAGALGRLHYAYGSRRWLGEPADGDGLLWGRGAEAVTSMLWLVGEEPVEAFAHGGARGSAGEVAFCHLRFAAGVEAEIRLSSMEPRREQSLVAVGSRAMGVFDELDGEHPLTIHERAYDAEGVAEPGDVVAPRLPDGDPVVGYCEHFVTTISSGGDGRRRGGAAVVAVLEALQRSLERGGTREAIGPSGPIAGVIRLPTRSAS
jgi:predicted dehydrogenase